MGRDGIGWDFAIRLEALLQRLARNDLVCSCKIYDSRGNAKVAALSTPKMTRPSQSLHVNDKVIFTKINSEAILHRLTKFDYFVAYTVETCTESFSEVSSESIKLVVNNWFLTLKIF
jgi:uncharacterized membrane protein affecting hemolysin expression